MLGGELISGRAVAAEVDSRTARQVEALAAADVHPSLAVLYVGDDAGAASYRKTIVQRAGKLGIQIHQIALDRGTQPAGMRAVLSSLTEEARINGILVQTPLSSDLRHAVTRCLPPRKDVEGITPGQLGRLLLGEPEILPCTAAAITALIESRVPDVAGRRIVIVNNSPTVGRPLLHVLLQRGATVTVCASHTLDLASETRRAEILVTAIGSPNYFGAAYIAPGALVIDVGINQAADGRSIVGDVDRDAVLPIASGLTAVPSGVGPVTTAMLFANVVELARIQHGLPRRAR